MNIPILTLVTFLPLAGAVLLIFVPRDSARTVRILTMAVSLLTFAAAIPLFLQFQSGTADPQFVEQASWIGYGIRYHVGIDGISLMLVMLTCFLFPIAILSSWTSIKEKVKEYHIFMLLLQTGILGVFVALNLFLFYVFWEAMLIPMYFLIGIWGGKRRIYATVKFVLFTMFGSLLMLVAIFFLYTTYYKAAGVYSMNIFDLQRMILNSNAQTWLFLAFALAFAIKVPMVPFHTWLPDAHVEAPTAGSVILAAVLLKMGAYGFLRFALPMFPDAVRRFLPVLAVLAVIGIIYGALMALVQKDIKSLVAYSSVSHMGLVMLAIFALNITAMEGAIYQMINHGISTGALFLCVGILYERAHTRQISDYGGVATHMPVFAGFFLVSLLSSVGLPGLNGFVGEILCLYGVFKSSWLLGALGVTTIILAAWYLLWMYQRVMHGPVTNPAVSALPDIKPREIAFMIPVIVMMFWMGFYPQMFLRKMDASVDKLVQQIERPTAVLVEGAPALREIGPPAIPAPLSEEAVQPEDIVPGELER